MKKLMSLLLCAVLLCASALAYDDVQGGEEIMALDAMGIIEGYEDGNFYPDRAVTNGEFAAMLCRALNLTVLGPSQSAYRDVPQTHWAVGYVNAIYDYGVMLDEEYRDVVIVTDDENGNMIEVEKLVRLEGVSASFRTGLEPEEITDMFYPDEAAAGEDALQLVLNALGYERLTRGGRTLETAQECGLLAGLELSAEGEVSRAQAARLIYNALNVPLAVDEVYVDPESELGYSFRVRILDGADGGEESTLYKLHFE